MIGSNEFQESELVAPENFVGSLTLPRPTLLPRSKFDQKAPLTLGDTEVAIYSIDHSDSETEFAALIDHEPLHGKKLLSFLMNIAPYKGPVSSNGVYADWVLPELARGRNGIRDNNPTLLTMHEEGLGRHWTDFESHRLDLMYALKTEHVDSLCGFRSSNFNVRLLSEAEMREKFMKGKFGFDVFRAIVDPKYPEAATRLITDYLREDGRINDRTYRDIMSGRKPRTVATLFEAHRKQYLQRYLNGLTDEELEEGFGRYVSTEFAELKLNEGQSMFVHRSGIRSLTAEKLQEAYDRRTPEYITGNSVTGVNDPPTLLVDQANILFQDGEQTITFLNTMRLSEKSLALKSLLHWKRTKLSDGTDRRELVIDHNVIAENGTRPRTSHNKLMGLLALAYFSPELRAKWPKEVKLKGAENGQEMGPAQVPVLALMQRSSLLSTPTISKMERIAA